MYSPGFLKDDFMRYLNENAEVDFLKHRSKFITAHSSNGYKRSITELLGDESLKAQLGDVKAAEEVSFLCFY